MCVCVRACRLSEQFVDVLLRKYDTQHKGSILFDNFVTLCVLLQVCTALLWQTLYFLLCFLHTPTSTFYFSLISLLRIVIGAGRPHRRLSTSL